MYRIFRLHIVALAIGLLLFGCSGGNTSDGNDDNAPVAKSWGTAEILASSESGEAGKPQIAFDSSGNAIAIWHQRDSNGVYHIFADIFNGTNWLGAIRIEDDDVSSAVNPQIAFDSNNNAFAIWAQIAGPNEGIYVNRFNGIRWGTAERIENNDSSIDNAPQIIFDFDGNAFAIWGQEANNELSIWANRYDRASMNWGVAKLIEHNDYIASYPQIVSDGLGNAIAVWMQYGGPESNQYNIWANRFELNSGNWGIAELIEQDDSSAGMVQIASDGFGNATAVWSQGNGFDNKIMASRFDGTSWGAAEIISSGDNAYSPQIAFDCSGNAIAVWDQEDTNGINISIYVNHFDGTAWSTAQLIEHIEAEFAYFPQISINCSGEAVAIWQQSDGANFKIMANQFDGTSWGAAEPIGDVKGDAFDPQISFDESGNAIAIWVSQLNGATNSIYVNHYK